MRAYEFIRESDKLDELSKDTIKSYFPKRLDTTNDIAQTDIKKAQRIVKKDLPRALSKLKDPDYGKKVAADKVDEGWGAERQKQELEQSNIAIAKVLQKYKNDPELLPIANKMFQSGHNAKSIEQTLQGRGQYDINWWKDLIAKTGPVKDWSDMMIQKYLGGSIGEAVDIEMDEKASTKLCRSTKKLGASDQSSCVSQGLRPHQSKGKGHTDGHGRYIKGKKAKSVQYGGDVKDYDGK